MFLAAVLLKIGGYGLYFVKPLVLRGGRTLILLIIFSVGGSLLAMVYCIILDDIKSVIAYRRIGHIGLVIATVLSDNEARLLRSLLIIVGHGFTSSLLFYLGNEAYLMSGSRSLSLSKGLRSVSPSLSLLLGRALVLNISFPPSINVFGEILGSLSIIRVYPSRVILVLLLVLLGGMFNIKFYLGLFHGSNASLCPRSGIRSACIRVRACHLMPYLLLPYIMSSI